MLTLALGLKSPGRAVFTGVIGARVYNLTSAKRSGLLGLCIGPEIHIAHPLAKGTSRYTQMSQSIQHRPMSTDRRLCDDPYSCQTRNIGCHSCGGFGRSAWKRASFHKRGTSGHCCIPATWHRVRIVSIKSEETRTDSSSCWDISSGTQVWNISPSRLNGPM
jgi:hypothetical protein